MQIMRGFPSFACCFALLVWIWYEHNLFFRRYGLHHPWTVFINGMLLFVTLFYVWFGSRADKRRRALLAAD